jgi:HAD superfamily hydrolase (TIGR01490 family)
MAGAGAAFFDVDETLIRCNSMLDFLEFHLGELFGPAEQSQAVITQLRALAADGATRQAVAERYFRSFADSPISELTDRGRRWFRIRSESPGFFSEAVLDRVRWHQRRGEMIVLVSGSLSVCVRPIAESIGAELAYSTELATSAGVCTGAAEKIPIGEGKAEVVRHVLREHHRTAATSHAYGDHISDLPMLLAVGHPTVVGRDRKLLDHPLARGWPILPC